MSQSKQIVKRAIKSSEGVAVYGLGLLVVILVPPFRCPVTCQLAFMHSRENKFRSPLHRVHSLATLSQF